MQYNCFQTFLLWYVLNKSRIEIFILLDCLILEDGTDLLPQNVANELTIYTTWHPSRQEISFTQWQKPSIMQSTELVLLGRGSTLLTLRSKGILGWMCASTAYSVLTSHFRLSHWLININRRDFYFTIVWPCIVTDSLWIKPTAAPTSNFIGITPLHVSGSLSAHHQEFLAVHRLWYILCSGDEPYATRSRMELPSYSW